MLLALLLLMALPLMALLPPATGRSPIMLLAFLLLIVVLVLHVLFVELVLLSVLVVLCFLLLLFLLLRAFIEHPLWNWPQPPWCLPFLLLRFSPSPSIHRTPTLELASTNLVPHRVFPPSMRHQLGCCVRGLRGNLDCKMSMDAMSWSGMVRRGPVGRTHRHMHRRTWAH